MIDVACGIIERNGKILAAKRKIELRHGGLWEFPGGKLDPTETAEAALTREIWEELAMEIRILQRLIDVVHAYPTGVIRLYPFVCQWVAGEPTLTDHEEIGWYLPEDLPALDWVAADLPVLDQYLHLK
ncbi:MAG: (deoxy)nucleoside triphosphate pyrophosphohydrolase [Bacteroidota bacterium]